MSLPPGFLDELKSRLSLAQVVGRKVIWDARKSNPGKGDMWAPCPFHQERSASFHVDDRKGYYYCFGCHAKGDALSFVRETENVGFLEAVEILAREAGMTMPARDPAETARATRRAGLSEVVEQAIGHYRLQLRSAAGAAARAYLARRGLTDAAIDRWEIGFAPEGRTHLVDALAARGVPPAEIVAAGLAAVPEGGGAPYDRFRGRVIFPIRDQRGRAISLGGRALDPAAPAKYLNGPETDLFDKGRTLFNIAGAREAAGKGRPVILAEGYMDVIALAEAGFGGAVAPLGTAVTETQLALLWRLSPEPVVALDGDRAGLAAGLRLAELALPRLAAGQSLRFALLPAGQDPDDLIRAGGAGAMQAVLDRALPMVDLLWQRETTGRDFDSPERRAALEQGLRELCGRIGDATLRRHYEEAFRDRLRALFRPVAAGGRGPDRGPMRGRPPPPAARTRLAAGLSEEALREAVILAILARNPGLLPEFLQALEETEWTVEAHRGIAQRLLAGGPEGALHEAGAAALESLMAEPHVRLCPAVARPDGGPVARAALAEEFAKLRAGRAHAAALAEAMEDIRGSADEWLTRRLSQAAAQVDRTRRQETEDRREVDMAPNGLALDRGERAALDRLLGRIGGIAKAADGAD